MNSPSPRISIGLPVYNRPEFLAVTLENLRDQTFRDFEVIISDNASPDSRVRKICEDLSRIDSRFRYVRQSVNLGAEANFWFVYREARSPFFMWASDDDLRSPDFIERGVEALERRADAFAWFCQVVNIDDSGVIVREYPSFMRFQSSRFKIRDLARFLWEPEFLGRANLVYSIFRRDAIAELAVLFDGRLTDWGADMSFVYGGICRFNLLIDNSETLLKRCPGEIGELPPFPRSGIYPVEQRRTYFRNYMRAASGTRFAMLTRGLLLARLVYDHFASGRAREAIEPFCNKYVCYPKRAAVRSFNAMRRLAREDKKP